VKFAGVTRDMVSEHGGRVIELRGDEALAVFESARGALRASVALQQRFAEESRLTPEQPLPVGIGIDTGEAIPVEDGYRGAALNLAARLCSLAAPGEILASDTVAGVARKLTGLAYAERGLVQLKGFSSPVKVVQVVPAGPEHVRSTSVSTDERIEQRLPIGGFLGSLPSGTLIGRHEQLGQVLTAIDSTTRSDGRLIMLAGEAGVGKTRLAQEVTLVARNRGFLIATGACYEPEHATPFYPFLDALAGLYEIAPVSVRNQVATQWAYLGRLLPNQTLPVPAISLDTREDLQRLFWAVTAFLQAIAEREPIAVLLDDLQWADGSSLSLLLHLARHTRSHRILLLGTYRDVEVDRSHPLEGVLLDLTRQQLVERIAVLRLPIDGTATLVADALGELEVSDEFARLLYHHTEGNPFFLHEVLRALVERGDVYREGGGWERRTLEEIEVPDTIRAVVGQRLSRLTEQAQEILHEASVLGQTFLFDDLRAVTRSGTEREEEIEAALEEAINAGLMREVGRDSYAFSHALTRQSLYSELPSRRKRRLHLIAGEALEQAPERDRERRLAELAGHFLGAQDTGRALRYAMLVADRAAATFAHDDAAQYYRIALDLAGESGEQRREAEASEKMGGLMTATIRYDEALWMLERAARLYRAVGDREGEGRVVAQIGRVHYSTAEAERGVSRLEPAIETLTIGGSAQALAGVTSVLSKLYFARARYIDALSTAERAAGLAKTANDNGVLAEAEITRGSSLAMLGRWRDGQRALEDSIPVAEAAGDVFSVCRALQNAASVHLVRGDFDAHRRSMERALVLAKKMGNYRQEAATNFGLSVNAFVVGDWAQAHRYADSTLAMMSALGATWKSGYHLPGLTSLAVAEGRWREASRFLEECVAISSETGDVQTLQAAQEVQAERDLLQGRSEDARKRLEALLGESCGVQPSTGVGAIPRGHYVVAGTHHVTGLLLLLAWAYVQTGDTVRADELVAGGIAEASAEDVRLALVEWHRIHGISLTRAEWWDEAEEAFGAAVLLAHHMPYPYAEARSLHEWSRMETVRKEIDRAREKLTASLQMFERLGALPYVEIARAELADLR